MFPMKIISITSYLLILSEVDVFENFKSLLYFFNIPDMYFITEMDLRLIIYELLIWVYSAITSVFHSLKDITFSNLQRCNRHDKSLDDDTTILPLNANHRVIVDLFDG